MTTTTTTTAPTAPDMRPLGDTFREIADDYDHEARASLVRVHRAWCRSAADAYRHAAILVEAREATTAIYATLAELNR